MHGPGLLLENLIELSWNESLSYHTSFP